MQAKGDLRFKRDLSVKRDLTFKHIKEKLKDLVETYQQKKKGKKRSQVQVSQKLKGT